MLEAERIRCDVLIIGGGSAGAMAAIRAKELDPGARVVIFEKSHIKYSGSIPRGMDALNIVAVPGVNSPEDYLNSTRLACEGVVDEMPSLVMAQRSWDLMQKLERWGVHFPRDKDGNYEVLSIHPSGRYTVTMREPNLKTMLAARVADTGCIVFNHTMAVDLMVQDGRVVGALGMNVRTGELVACEARSVILSAGGTARFGLPDSGYMYGGFDCPANSGDAYALAYRAGAELTGMEYTLCSYVVRDINSPLLGIVLNRGAQVFNVLGKWLNDPSSDGGTFIGGKDLILEHRQDRAPILIRLSHLPHEQIDAVEDILFGTERPVLKRFFEGRGIDFRHRDIELGPTEFTLCGGHGITGIAVDERAAGSVPGLFAAGDACNVGRGHLSGALVFGEMAAEAAMGLGWTSDGDADVEAAVDGFRRKVEIWQSNSGAVSVDEFEYKTRRLINAYLVPPKNEMKLRRALESMSVQRRHLTEQVRVKNVHDLVKALEVESIVTSATLSATASLERKESRWQFFHYRTDYPTKEESWQQHVGVRRGESEEQILTYPLPVKKLGDATSRQGRGN